jgi:type II secretory pathway pseudopilin PulG
MGVILMILAMMLAATVHPVIAASAGRQVKVTACEAVKLILSGTNAEGKAAKYTLTKKSTDCAAIKVPDKYWQGDLTVTAYYYVSSEYPAYKGQVITVKIPGDASSDFYSVTVSAPKTTDWIYWRAKTWVTDKVAYDQSSRHDGYRQDCSGFVSFAWQLPKPGTSPKGLLEYADKIAFSKLKMGDVLVNPSAHAMIFIKWVDKAAGTFIAYQEETTKTGTRERTMTLNTSAGTVTQGTYTYPDTYIAIRKK